jgi:hypothetical protein
MRPTDWTTEQDALLRAMYPANPMPEIVEATGRTMHAVYSRAKLLKLTRKNKAKFAEGSAPVGQRFQQGKPSWNAGKAVFKITARDLVLGEFRRNPVQTTKTLAEATGLRRSGCWTVCNHMVKQGEAHISGWTSSVETGYNKIATFTLGPGENVKWTPRQKKADSEEDISPYEILPIPRPQLGAWGCVWPNINQSRPCAGERNAA